MFRIYLLLNLVFICANCFSQEKINLKINLNHLEFIELYSGTDISNNKICIYNDTVMHIDVSRNNLFHINTGQNTYYLFIDSESDLECSFLENNECLIVGDNSQFSYFITDFYLSFKRKINDLLLLNSSSDAFEIRLFNLLNDDVFNFYQSHENSQFFNASSSDYFNSLIKYEYLNTLSIYLMKQHKDSIQVVPFYRDLNMSLLDWDDFKSDMLNVDFYELDVFQNYIFNSLILFASNHYKYISSDQLSLFNNHLFDFAIDHLPQEMLFFFFKTYINNFVNTHTKQYLKTLLKNRDLSQSEINYLLDSDNFIEFDDISIDKNNLIESDFYLEDVNGNKVSLSDFTGKLLYVDIWASWCGPCRHQFPYAKKLKEQFSKKQLKKINFIYISIDADYNKWKESLKKLNLEGHQFISPPDKSNSASSHFNVSSIPRYIIIDRNGDVLYQNAKRPSDETLFDELLNLIK